MITKSLFKSKKLYLAFSKVPHWTWHQHSVRSNSPSPLHFYSRLKPTLFSSSFCSPVAPKTISRHPAHPEHRSPSLSSPQHGHHCNFSHVHCLPEHPLLPLLLPFVLPKLLSMSHWFSPSALSRPCICFSKFHLLFFLPPSSVLSSCHVTDSLSSQNRQKTPKNKQSNK